MSCERIVVAALRIQTWRCLARILPVVWALTATTPAAAQSGSATLDGTVVDKTGAILTGVDVTLTHAETLSSRRVVTGAGGTFIFSTLTPGRYDLQAVLSGFRSAKLEGIVLNVDDRIGLRVELDVASLEEGVTVVADAQRISRAPSVSTVVDRQFVENLPLNGRSLQSLLALTPGVVVTLAGAPTDGQFSVNGQRRNANYVTVDGVSANVGITPSNPGQSGAGEFPSMTSLGGTNGLVSIDALQEFRIQTSTYAPEFGRMPGGQVSLMTRAGTNGFHGSVFEYFRDDAMDARDWFTNNRGLQKPQLKQHQFGGVLGGPIMRNQIFFFGSYEGLRLNQPRVTVVPVVSMEARRLAIPAIRPYVDALPIPNGRDLGSGIAEFAAGYSDPSRFDATSVRLDYHPGQRLSLFGRLNHAPSSSRVRSGGLSYTQTTHQNNSSVTLGSTWLVSNRVAYDVRVNYTTNDAPSVAQPDDFGGAITPPVSVFLPGRAPDSSVFFFNVNPSQGWSWGVASAYEQRQINPIASLTVTSASHEWKFGIDFRRISPVLGGEVMGTESLSYNATQLSLPRATSYFLTLFDSTRRAARFDNLSAYAQDSWRLDPRLTFTYGVRWEFVPPARASNGQNAVTLENLDAPSGGPVRIAPRDTPLWEKRYNNFAPRVGASYVLSDKQDAQLVIRGGFGMFHDLGLGTSTSSFVNYPFIASRLVQAPLFPVPAESQVLPRLIEDQPRVIYVMDRNIELPFTYQWNVSAERAFGSHQSISVGYVGADGHKLLKLDLSTINLMEWGGTLVGVTRNQGFSDYHALQLQWNRRLHHGLQSLVSYTLGRSRDSISSDNSPSIPPERRSPGLDYGYSDYDVRHVLAAAVTWQAPALAGSALWHVLARDWGFDLMLRAQSGVPVNVSTVLQIPPDTYNTRVDVVSGQPFWIDAPSAPGGRILNRAAFAVPAPATPGNLPRGVVRGFGARQIDLAVRREFRILPSARLQFRVEAFNLINTPNFADPPGTLSGQTFFGESRQMLNQRLGGLSSLYQIGGPRSVQLAVKILF